MFSYYFQRLYRAINTVSVQPAANSLVRKVRAKKFNILLRTTQVLLLSVVKPKAYEPAHEIMDGTYHIGDQRRLRRACASAQLRRSLRCSHTFSMEEDEGSDQKSDIYPDWMTAHSRMKKEFTEDRKYHNLMSWLIYCY